MTAPELLAWMKEMEERHRVGLVRYIRSWARLEEFPDRVELWDAEQVALACDEAVRKLRAVGVDVMADMTPHTLAAADPRDAARTIDWLQRWDGRVPADILVAALINALVRVAKLQAEVRALAKKANETP